MVRHSVEFLGASGLGLEGQRAAAEAYARASGGKIEKEFTEVESDKRSDRPVLAMALAQARRAKAKLVIAKLDRLARNVAFTSALMESGVDFVCCDNPNANRLTIHILAAVAEDEARRISERTIAAPGAARARGVALGSARPGHWDGREDARVKGAKRGNQRSAEIRHAQALEQVKDLMPQIIGRRRDGESLASIAEELNDSGQRTSRGSAWTPMAVKRVIDRAGEASPVAA